MGKHCNNSQYIKKKIDRDNFIKKNNKTTPKKGKKIMLETL
jgi:hypothetical protein